MNVLWQTRWQGHEIAVYRNEVEVDRFDARAIERVLLVYEGAGDFPGDVVQALVELPDEIVLLGAETGFGVCVNFERHGFWAERACVHWVSRARAPLPLKLRTAIGFWRLSPPAYLRMPKRELAGHLARWPLQGPQTWQERKHRRIARAQRFILEQA